MNRTWCKYITFLVLLLVAGRGLCEDSRKTSPLLLFWEESDIRDAREVRFRVQPFTRTKYLLEADPQRPSLWFSPSDAIPSGDDYRIYYQRIEKTQKEYLDQRTWCLGILKPDGTFVLPELGLFPGTPPGLPNVVFQRSPHKPTWGGFNVFQTAGTSSGLGLLYWDQPSQGEAGGMIAESTDGIHWRKGEDRAVFTEHNDAFSLVHDPSREEYLLYQTRLEEWPGKPVADNIGPLKRIITLRRSKDLKTWSKQEDILIPDSMDAPACEFYLLKAFRYGDRYAGFLMKYYADPSAPGKHSALYRNELILSPDGITWERPYRNVDIGIWTYVTPFVHSGHLCVAAYDKGGLGFYQTRIDGMVGCGTEAEGSFMTQPFVPASTELFLNADCSGTGEVDIEVLNPNGLPLQGFEDAVCQIRGTDSTRIPLEWKSKDFSSLAGREVVFRFRVRNAWVYSVTCGE